MSVKNIVITPSIVIIAFLVIILASFFLPARVFRYLIYIPGFIHARIFFAEYVQTPLVQKRFNNDVKKLPNVHVDKFDTFESQGFADITIKNKGRVGFFYGLSGIPVIKYIDGFDTGFMCSENTMVPLTLVKNGHFQKWFPFTVNSVRDLVEHYDEIVSILATFPRYKKDAKDYTFTYKEEFFQKNVTCNLSIRCNEQLGDCR